MDHQRRQPRFKAEVRAKWQRAMDELLIDAIFGSLAIIRRDDDVLGGLAPSAVRALRLADPAALPA